VQLQGTVRCCKPRCDARHHDDISQIEIMFDTYSCTRCVVCVTAEVSGATVPSPHHQNSEGLEGLLLEEEAGEGRGGGAMYSLSGVGAGSSWLAVR
jgi:hypothetical protein